MTSGSDGSPPSRNWTEWVKWSSFVQVTVVPAATEIDAGANRYEGGRSTAEVATGDALAALGAQPPSATLAATITASTRSDRSAPTISLGSLPCAAGGPTG